MQEDIIYLENITKNYENNIAIKDINLTIPKGKIFGLLGPNGAGKTTLIRIINKIITPSSGNIFFEGVKMTEHHLKFLGYMPEERGVYKDMKVEEQIVYFGMLRGLKKYEAKKLADEWFQRLDMSDWKNKKAKELSKGMGQKLQFVITVMHNPKLLILDEPFSGFDPVNTMLIKDEIFRLKNQGTTIILSTHRMDSVDELCDDIAIIYKSRKVLSGNVDLIKRNYSKKLLRIGIKTQDITKIKDIYPNISNINFLGNDRVEFSIETDNINERIVNLTQYGEIYAVNENIPTINDIFIEIVKR